MPTTTYSADNFGSETKILPKHAAAAANRLESSSDEAGAATNCDSQQKSVCNGGPGRKVKLPFYLLSGEYLESWEEMRHRRRLYLTNFRLVFLSGHSRGSKVHDFRVESVPLGVIDIIEEISDQCSLIIKTKYGRITRIEFEKELILRRWREMLSSRSSGVEKIDRIFSFTFFNCYYKDHDRQLALLDSTENREKLSFKIEAEFRRLDFDSEFWRITDCNFNFQVVATYPRRWIVPSSLADADIKKCAAARLLNRMPVAVWKSKRTSRHPGAVLLRSSQPAVGFWGWRNTDDEMFLRSVLAAVQYQNEKEENLKKSSSSIQRLPIQIMIRSWTLRKWPIVMIGESTTGNVVFSVEFMILEILIVDIVTWSSLSPGSGIEIVTLKLKP